MEKEKSFIMPHPEIIALALLHEQKKSGSYNQQLAFQIVSQLSGQLKTEIENLLKTPKSSSENCDKI